MGGESTNLAGTKCGVAVAERLPDLDESKDGVALLRGEL